MLFNAYVCFIKRCIITLYNVSATECLCEHLPWLVNEAHIIQARCSGSYSLCGGESIDCDSTVDSLPVHKSVDLYPRSHVDLTGNLSWQSKNNKHK